MPDTKAGRQRKGLNKQAQLDALLAERELAALGRDDEPPRYGDGGPSLPADD